MPIGLAFSKDKEFVLTATEQLTIGKEMLDSRKTFPKEFGKTL